MDNPSSLTYHSAKDWLYNSSFEIAHVVESQGSSCKHPTNKDEGLIWFRSLSCSLLYGQFYVT